MENMSHGLIGKIRAMSPNAPRDVIVVTVDQRNHGTRKTKKDTLSYNKNPWRLVAMTATLTGGRDDQRLIMDYLEDYAFPLGGRKIVEFMVTGVSLGGHVVWRLMQSESQASTSRCVVPCFPRGLRVVTSAKQVGPASLTPPQALLRRLGVLIVCVVECSAARQLVPPRHRVRVGVACVRNSARPVASYHSRRWSGRPEGPPRGHAGIAGPPARDGAHGARR